MPVGEIASIAHISVRCMHSRLLQENSKRLEGNASSTWNAAHSWNEFHKGTYCSCSSIVCKMFASGTAVKRPQFVRSVDGGKEDFGGNVATSQKRVSSSSSSGFSCASFAFIFPHTLSLHCAPLKCFPRQLLLSPVEGKLGCAAFWCIKLIF